MTPGTAEACDARQDVVARARRAAPPAAVPAPIRAIGVVTRDRTEALTKSLVSYAENVRAHGRAPSLVVSDDSPAPEVQAKNRVRLAAVACTNELPAEYAGEAEKESYAALLAHASGVAEDVVRYALLGDGEQLPRLGANRNTLVLNAIDRPILFSDDDVRCRFGALNEPQGGAALGGDDEAIAFFPDRAGVLGALSPWTVDVIGLHARWLGQAPGRLAFSSPIVVDDASTRMLEHLFAGEGRVVMTMPGVFGDCAADGPESRIMLPRTARAAMLSSEAAFRLAVRTREIIRVVPRVTLDHPVRCAPTFALDLRAFVPPFVPAGRDEDATFAVTERAVSPDHYLVKLPLATYHAAEARDADESDAPTLGSLLGALIGAVDLGPATDPEARLRRLGAALREIGALDREALEEHLRLVCAPLEQARADRLRARIAEHETVAPWWSAAAWALVTRIERRVAHGSYGVASDLAKDRTPEEARDALRRHVTRAGELFEAWPDLVAGARALAARGVRVARSIDDELDA